LQKYSQEAHRQLVAMAAVQDIFLKGAEHKAIPKGLNDVGPLILEEASLVDEGRRDECLVFRSMAECYARGRATGILSRVKVLCTTPPGQSYRTIAIDLEPWRVDLLVTLKTVLAYFEGRRRLPSGTTWVITHFLLENIQTSASEVEGWKGVVENTRAALKLLYELLQSCCKDEEKFWAPRIIRIGPEDGKRIFPAHARDMREGKPTRFFAENCALKDGLYHQDELRHYFEEEARKQLKKLFIEQHGKRLGIDPRSAVSISLPAPRMRGAFYHLEHEVPDVPTVLPGLE
jgi:hypothetical protein